MTCEMIDSNTQRRFMIPAACHSSHTAHRAFGQLLLHSQHQRHLNARAEPPRCRIMQEWSVSALCRGSTPARANTSVQALDGGARLVMFGGCDADGRPTDSLCGLDVAGLPATTWRELAASGTAPAARWGHSSFVWGGRLWVYGGWDGSKHLDDLHSLDLRTMAWARVHQGSRGRPNRSLAKHKSFAPAVLAPAHGCMLAFGAEPQDENADSSRRPGSPALRLHAFDLSAQRWSVLRASGAPGFAKLEALLCHDSTLLAVGWSPAVAKADGGMAVCALDLAGLLSDCDQGSQQESSRTPLLHLQPAHAPRSGWQQMRMHGILPSARTAAATAVLGRRLLLHGGLLCAQSVAGILSADAFSLDLDSGTWTRLAPAQERAVGSSSLNTPRASHCAVALPSASAVMLIGGTSNRQSFASCDTMECLRLVSSAGDRGGGGTPGSARPAGSRQPGFLSSTPTLLGIQPFSHVTTPVLLAAASPASAGTAPTPAVVVAGRHADAAAQEQPAAPSATTTSTMLRPPFDFCRFAGSACFSDIELVAGGTAFPAHRVILCALSPRFADLIERQAAPGGGAAEQCQPGVECRWRLTLEDVFPDVLALMLKYMYCRLTRVEDVPLEAAPLLFTAATTYGLSELRAACLRLCISSIALDNVCSRALLAHQHACSELSQACILFAAASPERFQQVLATPGYLHLNQAHPRIGQMLVAAATQLLVATQQRRAA